MRVCPSCASIYLPDKEFCGLDGDRLIDKPEEAQLGEMIGRYRLEEIIGRGSTGVVYRATHVDTNETRALKLLYGELASDRRTAERFRREAEAASSIEHPNVVAVHEYKIGAPSYIVMEAVDGRTLATAIAQDGIFDEERAAGIAYQVALGLAEAHRVGFVHRDLKPGNVMLIEGPEGAEIAKILDFGIVRPLVHDEASRLTQAGFVIGTPHYMAPEQIDESVLGPPVDVYALGAIIYEMLSGRTPYTGARDQVLMKKLMRDPDPLPPGTGPLGLLALRLLDRDPARRPQNALLVTAELHRLNLISEDPKTIFSAAAVSSPASSTGAEPWIEETNVPTVMARLDGEIREIREPPELPKLDPEVDVHLQAPAALPELIRGGMFELTNDARIATDHGNAIANETPPFGVFDPIPSFGSLSVADTEVLRRTKGAGASTQEDLTPQGVPIPSLPSLPTYEPSGPVPITELAVIEPVPSLGAPPSTDPPVGLPPSATADTAPVDSFEIASARLDEGISSGIRRAVEQAVRQVGREAEIATLDIRAERASRLPPGGPSQTQTPDAINLAREIRDLVGAGEGTPATPSPALAHAATPIDPRNLVPSDRARSVPQPALPDTAYDHVSRLPRHFFLFAGVGLIAFVVSLFVAIHVFSEPGQAPRFVHRLPPPEPVATPVTPLPPVVPVATPVSVTSTHAHAVSAAGEGTEVVTPPPKAKAKRVPRKGVRAAKRSEHTTELPRW